MAGGAPHPGQLDNGAMSYFSRVMLVLLALIAITFVVQYARHTTPGIVPQPTPTQYPGGNAMVNVELVGPAAPSEGAACGVWTDHSRGGIVAEVGTLFIASQHLIGGSRYGDAFNTAELREDAQCVLGAEFGIYFTQLKGFHLGMDHHISLGMIGPSELDYVNSKWPRVSA